jgi:Tol biopolymer transport system component
LTVLVDPRHPAAQDSATAQRHDLKEDMMRVRGVVAAVIVGAAVLATPAVATAAFPGANGRIVFEQGGIIYSIRQDGSDRRQLTTDTRSHSPRWSPDGGSIAFHRAGDVWVMNANGSAAHRLTSGAANDINPSWSPDGGQVVFSRTTTGTPAGRSLYVVSAAGGAAHLLTARSDGCAVEPTWSATGRYVVYWDQCASGVNAGGNAIRKVDTRTGRISVVVGVDGLAQPGGRVFFFGTGPDVTPGGGRVVFTAADPSGGCGVAITDLAGGGFRFLSLPVDCGVFRSDDPAVSPDGTQVVFTAGNENPQLAVVRTAGSRQLGRNIYESGTNDFPLRPDWQPRP